MKRISQALVLLIVMVVATGCFRSREFTVTQIMLLYSGEQIDYIVQNELYSDNPASLEVYEEYAQTLKSGDKYFFGREVGGVFENGIYEDLQLALSGKSGQAALDVFAEFFIYNEDAGLSDLSGGYTLSSDGDNTTYVRPFVDLAMKLYNKNNPAASVGNAFVDGALGFYLCEYGAGIIMIKSV